MNRLTASLRSPRRSFLSTLTAVRLSVGLAAGLVVGLLGCPAPVDDDEAAAIKAEAASSYPTPLVLHKKVISRSCAPNAGVCHDTSNYPELSSPAAFAATVNAWCNLAIPDPRQGFDHCERRGDVLISGSFRSEVGFVERIDDDTFRLRLRDPAVRTASVAVVRFEDAANNTILDPLPEWGVTVRLEEGSNSVEVRIGVDEPFFTEPFITAALEGLVQADANDNGTFGADEVGGDQGTDRILAPGTLERSYLWGRITGTVPGTRMPLANQALAEAEYVAMACFIEGLSGADVDLNAPINYDDCAYAKAPERFAIQ